MSSNNKCNKCEQVLLGKLLTCSGCGKTHYCSKICQQADWSKHKTICLQSRSSSSGATSGLSSSTKSFHNYSIPQLISMLKTKSATFSKENKQFITSEIEHILKREENDKNTTLELIKLAEKNIKTDEINTLLASSTSWKSVADKSKLKNNSASNNYKQQQKKKNAAPVPTQEQLRSAAHMIRTNPGALKKDPQFKNMTPEERSKLADEYEKMANDETYYKQMIQMQADQGDLNQGDMSLIRDVAMGTRPMDDQFIDVVISMLKKSPEKIKNLYKMAGPNAGLSEDNTSMLFSFIDYASSLDEKWLRFIAKACIYIKEHVVPITLKTYETVDKYSLGLARYILLAMVLFILYYVFKGIWYVLSLIFVFVYGLIFRNTSSSSSSSSSSISDSFTSTVTNVVQFIRSKIIGGDTSINASVNDAVKSTESILKDTASAIGNGGNYDDFFGL